MRPLAFWLGLFLSSNPIASAPVQFGTGRVLEEHSGAKYLVQSLLIAPSDFEPEKIRAIARHFLTRTSDLSFARLRIVTKPLNVDLRPRVVHMSYADAYQLATAPWVYDLQIAEVVHIRKHAILRVRYSREQVTTEVVAGTDPFQLRPSNHDVARIEWISHWLPGDKLVSQDRTPQNVTVFATSEKVIDTETAKRLFFLVAERIPHAQLEVYISPVPWFPLADEYPLLSPFGARFRIPSASEYDRALPVRCSRSVVGHLACR